MSDNAVEEVREFLNHLPQRTPQEAIGMRNEGGLTRGLIFAAAGVGIVILLGTAGPFVWNQIAPPAERQAKLPAAQSQAAAPQASAEAPANTQPSETPPSDNPAAADPDRLRDTLGIGEAKDADPNVNPRESELDNLLDGIK